MSQPFFNTSLRRDPAQGRDLRSRIDAQLAERIEEAVDFVCLDALVQSRRAHRLTEPAADNADDRAEFEEGVRAFLHRLEEALLPALTAEQRRALPAETSPRTDSGRVSIQVALAKALPDYWQRFDEIRALHAAATIASAAPGARPSRARAPGSGGERLGRLRRLLGGS